MFSPLTWEETKLRQGQLQRYLLKLHKKKIFTDADYAFVYPRGSNIGKIYGLPKTHKLTSVNKKLKLRPIISSISTYNYNLAQYLCKKLSPHIPKQYSTRDTFTFVNDISEIDSKDKFMISFDVSSLFTNIPLAETVDIAIQLLLDNEPGLGMSREELVTLFEFATAKSHFLFNDLRSN